MNFTTVQKKCNNIENIQNKKAFTNVRSHTRFCALLKMHETPNIIYKNSIILVSNKSLIQVLYNCYKILLKLY